VTVTGAAEQITLPICEGDGIAILFPAGVPGSEMFVVPLLLDERGAVGGEVDHDNAMILRADASAAGVKALEIFGLRREDGSDTKG
jgi:hypothetical protein